MLVYIELSLYMADIIKFSYFAIASFFNPSIWVNFSNLLQIGWNVQLFNEQSLYFPAIGKYRPVFVGCWFRWVGSNDLPNPRCPNMRSIRARASIVPYHVSHYSCKHVDNSLLLLKLLAKKWTKTNYKTQNKLTILFWKF